MLSVASRAASAVASRHGGGALPIVLACVSLLLSLVKSTLLQLRVGACAGWVLLLGETGLSVTVSALAAVATRRAGAAAGPLVGTGVALLVPSAALSVAGAAVQLLSQKDASAGGASAAGGASSVARRVVGFVLRAAALSLGLAALGAAFAAEGVPSAQRVAAASPAAIRSVLALVCAATLSVALAALVARRRPRLRAGLAAGLCLLGGGFAVAASCAGWFAGREQAHSQGQAIPLVFVFTFRKHVQTAIGMLPLASALMAVGAIAAAGDLRRAETVPRRLVALEGAAMAATGPLVVLAMAEQAPGDARQILFTALPQLAATTLPLLVAHGAALWRGKEAIEEIREGGGDAAEWS